MKQRPGSHEGWAAEGGEDTLWHTSILSHTLPIDLTDAASSLQSPVPLLLSWALVQGGMYFT